MGVVIGTRIGRKNNIVREGRVWIKKCDRRMKVKLLSSSFDRK